MLKLQLAVKIGIISLYNIPMYTASRVTNAARSQSSQPSQSPQPFIAVELQTAEHLGLLLGHQALPCNVYTLKPRQPYVFLYNKFLYGIYVLTSTTTAPIAAVPPPVSSSKQNTVPSAPASRHYLLHKTHNYKRLRLHHVSARKRLNAKLAELPLLQNLFHAENKTATKLFLKIIEQNDHFLLSYAGQTVPAGIRHYRIHENYRALKTLSATITPQLLQAQGGTEAFARFKTWGSQLSALLFPKELLRLLWHADTVYIDAASCQPSSKAIPLAVAVITDPKTGAHKVLNTCSLYLPAALNTSAPQHSTANKLLQSIGVYSSKEDASMIQELQAIAEKHRLEQSAPQFYSFGSLETNEIIAGMQRHDIVQLIYHGEVHAQEFVLMRNAKAFLRLSDLQLLVRVPKVLFFSTCSSEHPQLIKWFFKAGGQTLLSISGEIISTPLPRIMQNLYWQLFTRKYNIREAFHSTMRNLAQEENVAVFKLKLYGLGEEYFNQHDAI